MSDKFPFWFQIRERGKRYAIAVRHNAFASESNNIRPILRDIHNCFVDRCGVVNWWNIDPEYDWSHTTANAWYHIYNIPYGWRHPFLKWLNEVIGPAGSKPDLPVKLKEHLVVVLRC